MRDILEDLTRGDPYWWAQECDTAHLCAECEVTLHPADIRHGRHFCRSCRRRLKREGLTLEPALCRTGSAANVAIAATIAIRLRNEALDKAFPPRSD